MSVCKERDRAWQLTFCHFRREFGRWFEGG
jgi:hypothetical protein